MPKRRAGSAKPHPPARSGTFLRTMAYVFALWHAMHVLCIVSSSRFLNGRRAPTHAIARIFKNVLRNSVDKPPSGVFRWEGGRLGKRGVGRVEPGGSTYHKKKKKKK